jgi:hypothetical protein
VGSFLAGGHVVSGLRTGVAHAPARECLAPCGQRTALGSSHLGLVLGYSGLSSSPVMSPSCANFSVERMAAGGAHLQIRAPGTRRHRSPLRWPHKI